jgi:diguanylate cyclase (GGDEF)-like protein
MTGIGESYRAAVARLLLALTAVGIACWSIPASAKGLQINVSLCHAVTGLPQADNALPSRFSCSGTPNGYQQASLWLRADVTRLPVDRNDLVLMVHHSRFDRLAVLFSYADGTRQWQQVRSGHYGSHWRAGGQIAFEAPVRNAPLVAVTLRFDKFASHNLLRARLLPRGESGLQSAALGAVIGAALTLLLIGLVYNLSLAVAVRRQFLAWHGAWAGCMLFWGLIWSEMHLIAVPGMAGTVSAQTCTFLACLAVTLATASVVTSLDRAALPRWAGRAMLVLGGAVGVLGVPLALIRSAAIDTLGGIAGILILADLVLVAVCLTWAWRRGSAAARDFAGAWALPMATLAFIQFVDVEGAFWGGGSKIIVLLAAAWQTLWLSIAASRRFAHFRIERDHARAAEAQANELARRDPLTGLRNRRGFVETIEPLLEHVRSEKMPAGLLLIDIDRFKSINDAHGHEAGDMVLRCIARRLERWEGPMCAVARLGGEEFGLMIAGLEGFALARFADSVRLEIAACDHGEAIGEGIVTASIGVAETQAPSDFQQLFRLADQGLYAAKQQGRDRVVVRKFAVVPTDAPEPPAALRAPY